MGFGFRKSINLGGGVKLNVGKKGIGLSGGVKGARVSVGPRGTRARVSIPNTGIYYDQKLGAAKRSTRSSSTSEYKSFKATEREREKELTKIQDLQRARNEVEMFEEKVNFFISIHKDCTETFNWENIVQNPPFTLGEIGPQEKEARLMVDKYKPTFRDKFFNRITAKKQLLEIEIIHSKEADEELYQKWEELKELGNGVLSGDYSSYTKVIEDLAPFQDIKDLGSDFSFDFYDKKTAVINLYVHSERVIPSEEVSLTKTGKVSRKKMTKTKFYELYQDYVSSCILRISRELFALLPLERLYINAIGELEDSSTGQLVEGTVISILVDNETLQKLDLDRIDCSDSLVNFPHNMNFKKTKGFIFVDQLEVR
ncbi:DUF4236 domain-containing protein [Sutcliffiella horikoshii]|uniref:DUF4236 domain-containing protein n=1 Tax=Sutcliffiella horikoshii TaxID=79883 RepID=UPI001CFDFF4F|nr:DUF4236 domain-containing protein [Sutcliffiella horikoshii]